MGFLCRQGRIKMEVVVGLLIVVGMMLEVAEGIKCYEESKRLGVKRRKVTCGNDKDGKVINACAKASSNGQTERSCGPKYFSEKLQKIHKCYQKVSGRCVSTVSASEEDKMKKCLGLSRTTADDDSQLQGRQNDVTGCYCFTDLCNGGDPRKPTVKTQVVSAVLVAASLFISNMGLGSP